MIGRLSSMLRWVGTFVRVLGLLMAIMIWSYMSCNFLMNLLADGEDLKQIGEVPLRVIPERMPPMSDEQILFLQSLLEIKEAIYERREEKRQLCSMRPKAVRDGDLGASKRSP